MTRQFKPSIIKPSASTPQRMLCPNGVKSHTVKCNTVILDSKYVSEFKRPKEASRHLTTPPYQKRLGTSQSTYYTTKTKEEEPEPMSSKEFQKLINDYLLKSTKYLPWLADVKVKVMNTTILCKYCRDKNVFVEDGTHECLTCGCKWRTEPITKPPTADTSDQHKR